MFNIILSLLSEDSKISSLRLMSILCVLGALGIGAYGIAHGKDLIGLAALVTAFLGPAFAGKVMGKKFETKD